MKTKAEINQIIKIDSEDLKELKAVNGNVYIVNKNTGNITSEVTVSDLAFELYKQGGGLLGILNRVRTLLVNIALADCGGNQAKAARRLKVDPRTIFNYMQHERKVINCGKGEIPNE